MAKKTMVRSKVLIVREEAKPYGASSSAPVKIGSFRELRVWQEAVSASHRIFELSKSFPSEERYSLTDQVRRSARSVSANIAEGWGRRRYPAAFRNKLNESEGEACETQSWIEDCLRCGYISPDDAQQLTAQYGKIISMLVHMMNHSSKWTL